MLKQLTLAAIVSLSIAGGAYAQTDLFPIIPSVDAHAEPLPVLTFKFGKKGIDANSVNILPQRDAPVWNGTNDHTSIERHDTYNVQYQGEISTYHQVTLEDLNIAAALNNSELVNNIMLAANTPVPVAKQEVLFAQAETQEAPSTVGVTVLP